MAFWFLIIAVVMFAASFATAIVAGFARMGWGARQASEQARSATEPHGPWTRRGEVHYNLGFISLQHLRSGAATRAEWTQVIATMVALLSFTCIFLGIAWLVAAKRPIFALVILIVPTVWLSAILRDIWSDWRTAKSVTADARQAEGSPDRL